MNVFLFVFCNVNVIARPLYVEAVGRLIPSPAKPRKEGRKEKIASRHHDDRSRPTPLGRKKVNSLSL